MRRTQLIGSHTGTLHRTAVNNVKLLLLQKFHKAFCLFNTGVIQGII
ncbi:hypothetical protein EVA_11823 [gut metagenome]|uniref:Uncharacterized protein n=1 Tax=gut metagenome TaxID=749906 RepID=J9CJ54_9ZZZZ